MKTPIPIPSPDSAWDNMRKKLDDKMPDGAVFIPGESASKGSFLRRGILGSILLLLLLLVWLTVSKTSHPGSQSQHTDNTKNGQPVEHTINTGVPGTVAPVTRDIIAHHEKITSAGNNTLLTHTKNKKNKSEATKDKITGASNEVVLNNEELSSNDITNSDTTHSTDSAHETVIAKKEPSKTDSLTKSPEPETPEVDKPLLQAGVQWFLQVPTAGNPKYFTGPNGSSQPYRILVPGLWLTLNSDKFLLSFEVDPFYSLNIPNKAFSTEYNNFASGDTLLSFSASNSLRKVFGLSAELGYKQNITGNWWVGGNFRFTNWWSGAGVRQEAIEKKSASTSFSTINTSSAKTYRLTTREWDNFSKVQFHANLEALYRPDAKWQAGFKAGLPLTPLAKNQGPSNPFYAELFFRYILLNVNKMK